MSDESLSGIVLAESPEGESLLRSSIISATETHIKFVDTPDIVLPEKEWDYLVIQYDEETSIVDDFREICQKHHTTIQSYPVSPDTSLYSRFKARLKSDVPEFDSRIVIPKERIISDIQSINTTEQTVIEHTEVCRLIDFAQSLHDVDPDAARLLADQALSNFPDGVIKSYYASTELVQIARLVHNVDDVTFE